MELSARPSAVAFSMKILGPADRTSAIKAPKDQIMVILELSVEELVVNGCVAEMDSICIAFDYLVMDKTLENRLDAIETVTLKRDCGPVASLERIPCVVVSDSDNSRLSLLTCPLEGASCASAPNRGRK